ncbi:MAG: glycosyl transferase [Proteobacteria bacterium]|nr:MAG: glycosyl transferase [Pseudomonadota bacterium]
MNRGKRVALVGSVGVPAKYGGFETFAQELGPRLAQLGMQVIVTCDATQYAQRPREFKGCELLWVPVRANGMPSTLHDGLALLRTARRVDTILIMGVSGGPFLPLIRLISRARLVTNTDGVEWRRGKFGAVKRALLWVFDRLAQLASHAVVVDNAALTPFVLARRRRVTAVIPYGGDHAIQGPATALPEELAHTPYALTICRIEPENNIELLIRGFLASDCERYVLVGNWQVSPYARRLYERYRSEPRLRLMSPIYDIARLKGLRAGCRAYLHGHSVGGTNPSLVEMLFFDVPILAFDCEFNRQTALDAATYFAQADELADKLRTVWDAPRPTAGAREAIRARYTWDHVTEQYARLLAG